MKTLYHRILSRMHPIRSSRHYHKTRYRLIPVPREKVDTFCHGERIDPWAYIRVKNEMPALEASLESIVPVIKKGVIGYNDCTDGSEEFIKDFCAKNTGFIPYKYPHHVYPASHAYYRKTDAVFENTLAGYYTAVLNLIPKEDWFIKLDMDQIYFPEKLEKILYLPKHPYEAVALARLNLHYQAGKVYVIADGPTMRSFSDPRDQWLMFNRDLYFENIVWDVGRGRACEILRYKRKRRYYLTELVTVHFPLLKAYRSEELHGVELVSIDEYFKIAPLDRIDPAILDEKRLLDMRRKFRVDE